MRDEPTPTEQEPRDVLAAELESFRKDPSELDLFRELKRALKAAKRDTDLAELFELRAPVESDEPDATQMWLEAAKLRIVAGEIERGLADFRRVLDRSPAHDKAAPRAFDALLANSRFAEAANVAEAEIEALESLVSADGSASLVRRLAERFRAVARLWQDHLGRLDKALLSWQRSFQLEPHKTEALKQSRVIYKSLGDDQMVTALYETELELMGELGDNARRAEIELALGRLKRDRADTQGAAQHLESALKLNPDSVDAQESLAEVLSSLEGEDEHRRASELFVDLGERRMQTEDPDGAISFLRRALGADPSSRKGTDNLESMLTLARRWPELDRLYQNELLGASTPEERTDILTKRAALCERELADRDGLKACLRELAAMHGPNNDYTRRLRILYEEDHEGEELVQLIEAELTSKAPGDPEIVQLLLELTAIYRDQLRDRDKAAETLHRILGHDSLNAEALARYAEHFRERRDWRGLTDLQEYTIDRLREQGAAPQELIQRLEVVAELCEQRLGDIDRAISSWRRIEAIEGHTQKTSDALQRLMSRAKMWESLVGVLEQEAAQAPTPALRAEALRRIAQVYRERQVNPRRAITLYEEVLSLFPEDDGVLKAVAELYEREGDDAGLAHTIRRQLDLAGRRLDESGNNLSGSAREWPVAKRVERLTALRRISGMYESQLADVEGVVYACSGILELLPGDREALERMERVLEKAGDNERLEQTLEYHVACSTAPVERSKLLRRLARLAEARSDELAAMERWESVLRTAPNDAETLRQLALLYERHRRFPNLAEVLDRALMNAVIPQAGSAAAAEMSAEMKKLARVLDDQLQDGSRAIKAWQRVLLISERDRDALNALCRLHEDARQWRDLAEVLERQIPIYAADDPDKATALGLKRADLLEDRLGSPDLATQALEHLIAHVAPRDLEAHRKLRRLYETRGSFEPSIRVAEREMVLTEDPKAKISRGLEIGLLCRDRINDPKRALQAYERVLKLDPDHEEAIIAAAELYAKVGRWRKHVVLLEKRIKITETQADKRALMLRIANVTAEELENHREAFTWYSRAHELGPDATSLGELRRAAENYGLWRELANVFEGHREQLRAADGISDKANFVAISREIASIAESRLHDPNRAIDALHAALEVDPRGQGLLAEAERLAEEANQKPVWDRLLECFELRLAAAHPSERIQLLLRRAKLREERAHDISGALADLLRAFSCAPYQEECRELLYSFGDRQNHWQEILSMETALAERAPNKNAQVEILRRKANAYEDRAKDDVRAFRTHISSFILIPEDEETLGDLWRLAKKIGRYTESQRIPEVEALAAHIDESYHGGQASKLVVAPLKPRRDATQELSISDLVSNENPTLTTPDADNSPRAESTQELDLSELMIASSSRQVSDPTMELRTEDLIEALGRKTNDARPVPPPPANARAAGQGPPPPPPPRPQIKPMPGMAPTRKVGNNIGKVTLQASESVSRHTLPSSPRRAYSSPWSELATVYQKMPAENDAGRLRWHYRAAEVWETGAKEVGRAFDVLAKALRAAPANSETRERLFQLASTHGEWDRLADLYDRAAETASSADGVSELLMQVASIRAKQDRPRETESLYRRVLGMCPENSQARQELEELYRLEERWIDLAAQLEERTDPRLGTAAPISQRPALLRELAGLYSKQLGRPHDAIETLERLVEIEPENVELLRDIAAAYEGIGKWSKVIHTLTRLCDLADGKEVARDALRNIAEIYERELELPDRAIMAYSNVLIEWPTDAQAFDALDRLYQQYARWEELATIVGERAAIIRDQPLRAALLHRRARIMLEWLDQPEEAAAELRHARTIDPENTELADDLVLALTRAGRDREAASVLEGCVSRLRAAEAAEGDIAALLIRLGTIRGEHLRDPIGAKQVLEEALSLVPSHPTALAVLARLTSADKDPRVHGKARLREAQVLTDTDAKIEALFDAGTSFRDGGDSEAARDAFERILALRPYHADATWALAALVEKGGDVDEAIRLLSARLDAASLEAKERAEVLTQLAALSKQAGVESAAERRLKEALEQVPDHLPAILGLADLLASSEAWPELETFLNKVLPALESHDPATRSEILRRLAIAYESMDRSDEAYQALIIADRLHRGSLLVKLALGENRYRARRWREAALHLSALASRDDSASHPTEVAAGLYHAALAEIRSLRPEKAEGLYRAALKLKNNFSPALHALAELAMERGNMEEACDLLTKQAVATEDPGERVALFEALGDMAVQQLDDKERAKTCYEAAVRAAAPLDSRHKSLLEKLLALQLSAHDRPASGLTCELLASFTSDPQERCERHAEAAQHFIAGEMAVEAREAAERAVSASPYDLLAGDVASELAMQAGDFDTTAALLGRLLNHNDHVGDSSDILTLARLWNRLAQARKGRGDLKGYEASLVKTIETAPESPSAMDARRTLTSVWGDSNGHLDTVREYARVLAADSLTKDDVAAYARSRCRSTDADGARSALELAAALGYEHTSDDVAFLARHPVRIMAEDEAYKGSIDRVIREQLILDPDDSPMLGLCSTLWGSAALLWPSIDETFARNKVVDATRVAATGKLRAAVIFTRIARALDAPATILYTSTNSEAPDVQVVCVSPPVIVFGPRFAKDTSVSDLELRFKLARAAELARPARIVAAGQTQDDYKRLIASLWRVFGDGEATQQEIEDGQHQRDEELRKTLPVRARAELETQLTGLPQLFATRYLEACQRAADRAGLLICGDIDTALRHSGVVEAGGDNRHLLALPLHRAYLDARSRLGISSLK